MSQQDLPPREQTKEELLRRIRRAYQDLDNLLRPLSDETLSMPDTGGWSIKDHLSHMATWEMGIVNLLRKEPRFAEPYLADAVSRGMNEDEINDLIFRQHAGLNAAQARELLDSAHAQMLMVLEDLDNEDLFKPYTDYLPVGEDGSDKPVLGWIVGNTYGHYDEHLTWIRQHPAYPANSISGV